MRLVPITNFDEWLNGASTPAQQLGGSTPDFDAMLTELGGSHGDFIRSVYQQESTSGAADTSQANYAGARGPMQVTADTFAGMQRQGQIPADWRHDNAEHTTRAGIMLARQLADQYGGDYRKAAAAYYSGPKAVQGDNILDLRDPKNPKAPSTLQYADQVTGRLSGKPASKPAAAPKQWSEVAASKDFKALTPEEREAVRNDYFERVVAPMVPTDQLEAVRADFDDRTAPSLMRDLREEMGQIADEFGRGVQNLKTAHAGFKLSLAADVIRRNEEKLAAASQAGDAREVARLQAHIAKLQDQLGIELRETVNARMAASNYEKTAKPSREAVTRMTQAKTWGEAWDAFASDPYGAIMGVTAESAPMMIPGLLAGVVNPVAGAATMGATSAAVEYGSGLLEYMADHGVNAGDEAAMRAFLSDPAKLKQALAYSATRAQIIGALDAASAGVASKVLAPRVKSELARQAINVPTQTAVQGAAGAGGEAAAQVATKGEITAPGQVVAEAVGEAGGAVPEVLAMGRAGRADRLRQRAAELREEGSQADLTAEQPVAPPTEGAPGVPLLPAPEQPVIEVDSAGVAATSQQRTDLGLTPDVRDAQRQRAGEVIDVEARTVEPAAEPVEPADVPRGTPAPALAPEERRQRVEAVRNAVDAFERNYPGASRLDIQVVESLADLPEDVGARSGSEGLYDRSTGEVYLVVGEFADNTRAAEVLAHEVVGHHGVESLVHARKLDWRDLMVDVHRALRAKKPLTEDVGIGHPDYATVDAVERLYKGAGDTEIAMEVLARLAETGERPGFVDRLVSIVRASLRPLMSRLGVDMRLSAAELRGLVDAARKHVQRGENRLLPAEARDNLAYAQGLPPTSASLRDSELEEADAAALRMARLDVDTDKPDPDIDKDDFEEEMQRELRREQAANRQPRKADDEAIKAAGIHAEYAFEEPKYTPKYDAATDTTDLVSDDGMFTVREQMFKPESAGLHKSRKYAGDTHEKPDAQDGGHALDMIRVTKEAATIYNRVQSAAMDLRRLGFDLLKAVSPKQAKAIVQAWRRVAANPQAFRFLKPHTLDRKGAERIEQIARQMGITQRFDIQVTHSEQYRGGYDIEFLKKNSGDHLGSGKIEVVSKRGGGAAKGGTDPHLILHAIDMEADTGIGTPFYQIAAQLAADVGYYIKADPGGLTGINTYRRTEQMMSAALRNDLKSPLRPGVAQRIYGWNREPKTVKQHEENFTRLAVAQARNVAEFWPEVKGLRYDPATDAFTRDGKDANAEVAAKLDDETIRSAGIGHTSVARAAVTFGAMAGDIVDASKVRRPFLYSKATTRSGGKKLYTSGLVDSLFKAVVGTPADFVKALAEPAVERVTRAAGGYVPSGVQRLAEHVKHGIVSDYGLDEPYLDAKIDRDTAVNQMLRKTRNMLEGLAHMTSEQSRVAYFWMQEKPNTPEEQRYFNMLSAEDQKVVSNMKALVDQLGREAVKVGLLNPETYEKNKMAYLHRTYRKHIAKDEKAMGRMKRSAELRGENMKMRGIKDTTALDNLVQHARDGQEFKRGDKMIRLELRSEASAKEQALGRHGNLLRQVAYVPVGEPIPAALQSWKNDGEWEIMGLDKPKGKALLRRQLTREERMKLGEVEEVRFALAKTALAAVRDIENQKFLGWVKDTYAKKPDEVPDDKMRPASEGFVTIQSFAKDEWVIVPSTTIAGTGGMKKYGPLAGLAVPGVIWNDLRHSMTIPETELGKVLHQMTQAWKVSKTALSPAVHMNNVMSNFIFADMADVGGRDIGKAVYTIIKAKTGDEKAQKLLERYEDSGGEKGAFAAIELREGWIDPVMKDILEGGGALDQLTAAQIVDLLMSRSFVEGLKAAGKKAAPLVTKPANFMIDKYQAEDLMFRFAKWMKEVENGATDRDAGKAARKSFLDYDINAPWINVLRRSGLPFIAFTYRAIPLIAKTFYEKPWKAAKYVTAAAVLNALAYTALGGDGDEDRERKLLPEEMQGKMWGVFPRMLRMPWNDENDAPVFLDVRRWIPAGDVFDLHQSQAALPVPSWLSISGPLSALAELFLNKSTFTGKPIVEEHDSTAQKVLKVADWQFKFWSPNLPVPGPGYVVPGTEPGQLQTYSWTGIVNAASGVTDAFGREMDLQQAMLNSIGVKAKSYPEDVARTRIVRDLQDAQEAAQRAIQDAARARSRGKMDDEQFNGIRDREREKMRRASDEARQRLN